MLENKEMVYTAIFQNGQGSLVYQSLVGTMNKREMWFEAAQIAGSHDMCLVALIPGTHPVYFYSDFVELDSDNESCSDIKNHDLFELN